MAKIKRIRKNICITMESIEKGEKLVKKGQFKSFSRMLELIIDQADENWDEKNTKDGWIKKVLKKEN